LVAPFFIELIVTHIGHLSISCASLGSPPNGKERPKNPNIPAAGNAGALNLPPRPLPLYSDGPPLPQSGAPYTAVLFGRWPSRPRRLAAPGTATARSPDRLCIFQWHPLSSPFPPRMSPGSQAGLNGKADHTFRGGGGQPSHPFPSHRPLAQGPGSTHSFL